MTPEQKQELEQAAINYADKLKADSKKANFYDIYESGAQHILDHPSDFGLFSREEVINLMAAYGQWGSEQATQARQWLDNHLKK